MTHVKICGNRRIEDIDFLNTYKPDYAGMILSKGFGRTVEKQTAQQLRLHLDSNIPMVGVFVDDDLETILSFVNEGIIDVIQLHGKETPAFINTLKESTDKPIWKVFRMNQEIQKTEIEESPADLVLLDAGAGSGKAFDWSLTNGIQRSFILAGGLNEENVTAAITQTHPFMVDTSSGVETDGYKDKTKVGTFIEKVRREA